MKAIRLLTALSTLDRLHRQAEGKKNVHMSAQDLTNLLIDHSNLCRILTDKGVMINESPPRSRPKFEG